MAAIHGFCSKTMTAPVLLCIAVVCVSTRPKFRKALQSKIANLYESQSTKAACAGIAALIGNCTVQEALKHSTSRFRSVCMSRLEAEHFRSSPAGNVPPGPEFFALTEAVKMGECDAFLSHSWHDEPEAKWSVLQRWRQRFLRHHGREPRIWFDKYCIDQTDVEENLRGLPVFVSGCKEMIVLCGPTYLQRLWCIVELFTFVHMGGNLQRITVLPLVHAGHEPEDEHAIRRSLANFDARQCMCACTKDKIKMLDIICTAYGGIEHFHTAVQSLFQDLGLEERLRGF